MRKINDIFPERGKIDKAQFTLDRLGQVLDSSYIAHKVLGKKSLGFIRVSNFELKIGRTLPSFLLFKYSALV